MSTTKTSKTERRIVDGIGRSWSPEKDVAQPRSLEWEIQFALGCSWGRALTLANELRVSWGPR